MKKYMKNKLKIIYFILLLSLFFKNNAFSYWINYENNWFYSNISKNIWKLDSDLYSIELQSNWWTSNKINEITWNICLQNNLTEEQINKISNWNIEDLKNFLNENCRTNVDLLNKTFGAIQNLKSNTQNEAQNKSQKILNFSNIWVYNDWIEWNWPFDIIKDFENIDKIIFENKGIEEKNDSSDNKKEIDLWEKIKELINNFAKSENISLYENKNEHTKLCDLSWNCDNYTEVQKIICEKNWNCSKEEKPWFLNIQNNFLCKKDSSWLKETTWLIISKVLDWKINNENNKENDNERQENTKKDSNKNIINPSWWYNKINDNKFFPCNNFFCIKIEFKKRENWLLSSGKVPSIEFLIKRSNWHLEKINSSLSQSKMTTNNFELSLKDINLSEMFHMWFQISYEPVPILKIDKEGEEKEEDWELWLDSQLEKYYEAHWLNYKLRNDISNFNKIDVEKQIVLNTSWTSINKISQRALETDRVNLDKLIDLNWITKTLEEKVKVSRVSDIEEQMKEIEVYNKAINNYIINLGELLKKMVNIPVDWSMN